MVQFYKAVNTVTSIDQRRLGSIPEQKLLGTSLLVLPIGTYLDNTENLADNKLDTNANNKNRVKLTENATYRSNTGSNFREVHAVL